MTNLLSSNAAKVVALALSVGTAGFLIVQAQKQANPAPPAPAAGPSESGHESTTPATETPVDDASETWFLGTSKSAMTPTVQPPLVPAVHTALDVNADATAEGLVRPIPRPTTLGTSKSVTIQLPDVLMPDDRLLPTSKSLSPMDLERLMGQQAETSTTTPKKDQ